MTAAELSTQTRASEFRAELRSRVMLGDGAMGSLLIDRGVSIDCCFDELNLSFPHAVKQVHDQYVAAGARIIETNTFGANRRRLDAFGFADQVNVINREGVRLARESAGHSCFVAGAMGPFSDGEQAQALVDAGVDLLILETFYNLAELGQTIDAARLAAGPEMVIVAQVTVNSDGRMQDGSDAALFTRVLDGSPADVIGVNCSTGPDVVLETIQEMASLTSKPLSAMPSAGLPALTNGRSIYPCSPESMARFAPRFIEAGVRLLGGCCGVTPQHIQQAGDGLK